MKDAEWNAEFEHARMTIKVQRVGDTLVVEMTSPLHGWVAFGLNDRAGIDGMRFVMAVVEDGACRAVVHRTKLPGYRPSGEQVECLRGVESAAGTRVLIRWPLPADVGSFAKAGTDVDAMLAFSESDDFQHHSRVRHHFKIRL